MNTRYFLTAFLFIQVSCLSFVQGQDLQFGWLMPDPKLDLPLKDIAYLPDDGLNLYDKPGGEVIARLGRDPRKRDYPNYAQNIFLLPRDRTPELLSSTALAPLPQNCFAVPFVKQMNGFVKLFEVNGPYHYWVDIREITRLNFYLTDKLPELPTVAPTINSENGAGLLVPDFAKLADLPRENYAHMPAQGLTLYNRPGGEPVAKLSRFCPTGKFADGNMRMFVLPLEDENNCRFVTTEQLHHWSDDTYMIPYYKYQEGYVLLFNKTELGPTWAKATDIESQNFKILGWKDYFIEMRSTPAIAKEPGLNLREGPYTDALKIITIKGESMHIIFTGFDEGFCEGPWCKVKVREFRQNPCTTSEPEEKNLVKEYEGWIKIISDDGQPNVYINTKGC